MTKTAHDENFPVATWFVAPRLRPTIRAYYAFARAADDIADDPDLTVDTKLGRLDALAVPDELSRLLAAHGVPAATATDLLAAFRRDARNDPIATPADLDDYCRHSAAPVGRFLVALHGERAGHVESDALCAALQVLNHVQDARADWLALRRCYIPAVWLADAGTTPDRLCAEAPGGAGRALAARMVDHAAAHLARADALPCLLADRGLAAQSAAILALARRLAVKLRGRDPWAGFVGLSGLDWAAGFAAGARALARPGRRVRGVAP